VTTATPDDDTWRPGPVTVLFTATDYRSGVARTEYSVDNGATWSEGTSLSIAAAGPTVVLYRSIDHAGNQESAKTVVVHVANTVSGDSQTVELPGSVALTFDAVETAGYTTVTESTDDPGPDPPPFQVAEQSFYQIETTAAYAGPVKIAFPYDPTGLTIEQQQALRLMHLDGGEWVDVTVLVDTETHVVYGSVTHFSWFAVAVDTTPPDVSVTAPADGGRYILNQIVTADWSAEDCASGIDSAHTYSAPVASGAAIDTSTFGEKTLTVVATDAAGNVATKMVTYRVIYGHGDEFRAPINADGSSCFKLGSTVPVKFQLTDAVGNPVPTAVTNIDVRFLDGSPDGTDIEVLSTASPTTGTLFRYADGQYIFNLGTKNLKVGDYRITALLDDGSSIVERISLRK
jgi:hypothetical protein